ncbi:MAG: hypothetical protein LBD82_01890 [Deltaproteobacteria bacterium]|jgi:hypothetical protein|nr:hypothetical protein [Deltaproteobacteria bacterium]
MADEEIIELTDIVKPGQAAGARPGAGPGDAAPERAVAGGSPQEEGPKEEVKAEKNEFGADFDALMQFDALLRKEVTGGKEEEQPKDPLKVSAAPVTDPTPAGHVVDPNEELSLPPLSDLDSILKELGVSDTPGKDRPTPPTPPQAVSTPPAPPPVAPAAPPAAPSAPAPAVTAPVSSPVAPSAPVVSAAPPQVAAPPPPVATAAVTVAPPAPPAAAQTQMEQLDLAALAAGVAAAQAAPAQSVPAAPLAAPAAAASDDVDMAGLDTLLDTVLAAAPRSAAPRQAPAVPVPVPPSAAPAAPAPVLSPVAPAAPAAVSTPVVSPAAPAAAPQAERKPAKEALPPEAVKGVLDNFAGALSQPSAASAPAPAAAPAAVSTPVVSPAPSAPAPQTNRKPAKEELPPGEVKVVLDNFAGALSRPSAASAHPAVHAADQAEHAHKQHHIVSTAAPAAATARPIKTVSLGQTSVVKAADKTPETDAALVSLRAEAENLRKELSSVKAELDDLRLNMTKHAAAAAAKVIREEIVALRKEMR